MPLVNRTFSQLIDFTRTTSATYVNSAGLIATTPASVNLLTYTQEFDNAAWTKTNTTVTANAATAPDGTATADKLAETATTAVHNTGQSITTTVQAYSFSCYVKAAERNFALLYHTQSNASVSVNLTTGATGTASGTVAPTSSSVTSVGNGWWRVTMTVTATAASNFFGVYVMNDLVNASYAGTAGSGIYIWGAQLEVGSTATEYTRNYGGLYPPRFDYDPVTLAPKGLLIEEQRTNLFTNSEFPNGLSDAPTRGGNVSTSTFSLLSGNTGLAINNTGSVTSFAYKGNFTTVNGTTYTISAFVRMDDGNAPSFVSSVTADSANSFALVVASSAINPLTYVVTAMGNGFYRVSATVTAASASSNNGIVKYNTNDSRSFTVSGYQIEAGAFATSYIPTVASQVTRTADSAVIQAPNFASWYNQSEGTFVAEFQTVALRAGGTTGHRVAVANDGSNSNVVYLYTYAAIAGGQVVTGGVNQADINGGGSPANNTTIKSAIAYATNNVAVTVNGATPTTDTSVTIPTVNQLGLGSQQSASQLNGWLRSVRYYPTRLTNAQLQALTA